MELSVGKGSRERGHLGSRDKMRSTGVIVERKAAEWIPCNTSVGFAG